MYHLFLAELWPEQWCRVQFEGNTGTNNEMLYIQRSEGMQLAAMQRVASAFMEDHLSLSSGREQKQNDSTIGYAYPQLPTLLSTGLAASINPCRWLEKERTKLEQPYYLWDVQAMETVETSNIKDFEYIFISHTWGRSRLIEKVANIPGVPWLVPCNERFHVEGLPCELAQVFGKGYVWINLFCIPQNGNEIALREIARQAIIFQNASAVIG